MIGGIGGNPYSLSYSPLSGAKTGTTGPQTNGSFPISDFKTDPAQEKMLKNTGQIECATCASRTYVDGSNENNVSFKAPGHISPEASFQMVSAHEGEHVSNAKSEGSKPGARLVSASVSLQSAVCPECGRGYIAGGTTRTQMKYTNEDNPYQKDKKLQDGLLLRGANINTTA